MLEISEEDIDAIQQEVIGNAMHELIYTYRPMYDKYCAQYGANVSFADFLDGNYALEDDMFAIMSDAIQEVMGVDADTAEEALMDTETQERIFSDFDFDYLIEEASRQ